MDVTNLGRLMDLMREKRALKVRVDGIEVELSPHAFGGPAPVTSSLLAEAPDRCPCGCLLVEHSEAGCLNGCIEERCVPSSEVRE